MASSSETPSSVRYGISSMLVQDKPAPVRISSVLTARHLLPRTKYPPRKYKNEGSMVPLFSNDDTPTTLKADALFIPRENPTALINFPMDQWPRKASEKASFKGISSREANTTPNDRTSSEDREILDVVKEQVQPVSAKHTSNGSNEDHSLQKADMYKSLSGHRAGVEALLPKLRKSDYFTLPGINELAAKESAQPGFCSEVKDFIVGRHGYGSIKFFGATDVRWLDLESIIQFNNYGVSVYKDDSKKPPVGQGLNKPAEITLLNIKCFDKQNELEYKEVLKSMAKNQGAEYVSYDATKGEWIFKVHHFSSYGNVFSFDHECSIRILGDRRKGDSFMKGSVTMGIETHSSFILCSKAMLDNFSQLRELGFSCPNIVLPTQVCIVDEEKYFVAEDLTLVQKYFSDKCAEFMEKEGRQEADYCNMEVKEKEHAIIRLWNTIEEDCYKFARDVTKGLAFLDTKKFLGCGNLNNGIFVRRKKSETCDLEFRLLPSMKGNEAFSDDIRQLVGILLSIIFPPAWNFNSEANRNYPCTSIRNYISFLDSFGYLAGTEGVLCILDHPYIWTIPERVGYMTIIGKLRKFYNFEIVAIGRRLVDKYFDGDLIKWQELVRKNPLFNAILKRANNTNTHIPHYGGAYDDVFRFHVACYSHSNDVNFAAEKKAIGFLDAYISDETIDGLLNDIFPDFYDFLKYSTMTYKKPRMHASGRAKFRLNMLRGMNQIE